MSFEPWNNVMLGDVVDIISGGTPKTTITEYWEPEEIDWITAKDVSECENRTIRKTSRRISKKGLENSSARILEPLTTVLIARGATTGKVALSSEGMAMNQTCYGLQAKEGNDKLFIYYLMLSRYNSFRAIANGSIFETVIGSGIKSIQLNIPTFPIQQSIGKILGALDDKIELNNAINKNLEEMAQALFKRWFVDFEFPNEKGEPYKSSGGEFEESELGLIPRGWKVKKISEVTNIVRGASPRPIQDYIDSKGMPWIKISDATEANSKFIVKTKEFIKKAGISKSRKINPGTLILSNSATPGIPMFVLIEACVHDGWLIFKDFFGVSKEFLYYFLLREREGIVSLSNGSVFRNLKTDILKNYKIIIPKDSVLMQADVIFKSINESIASRIYQNEQLAELRDTLLPKLMSGEIRVPVERDNSATDLPKVAESNAIYQP